MGLLNVLCVIKKSDYRKSLSEIDTKLAYHGKCDSIHVHSFVIITCKYLCKNQLNDLLDFNLRLLAHLVQYQKSLGHHACPSCVIIIVVVHNPPSHRV